MSRKIYLYSCGCLLIGSGRWRSVDIGEMVIEIGMWLDNDCCIFFGVICCFFAVNQSKHGSRMIVVTRGAEFADDDVDDVVQSFVVVDCLSSRVLGRIWCTVNCCRYCLLLFLQ